MSIPVDLAALEEALERHDTAYLLTGGSPRPHVAQVSPRWVDSMLVIEEPGRTARRVVGEQPALSVLLPPREPTGYSLIIDGDGSLDAEGALRIAPTHAVLHRAGSHASQDGASACGNDCQPIAAQA